MRPRRRFSRRSSSMPSSSARSSSSVAATPASIFMARSISSAAVSSGTLPISFRYMRTGSPVSMVTLGVGAAFARRAGLALRHLRQLHLDGCLELLLGNALEQVLVLVKAGFQLVVVQRIGSADVGLHVQRVVIVQYLFGIDRGFRTLLGVGLDSLVLRGLGHVIFLSNWMRSGMRKHARRAQRYSGAVYHRSSAFAAYFSHAFPIRQSPPGAVRQSSATCYSSGGMKERSVS